MKVKSNTFKRAVEQTLDITDSLQEGLKALGKHSVLVKVMSDFLEGSVNLDESTRHKYPNDSRWDYMLGYKKEIFFVEVHSAQTSKVSEVLKKHSWLKDWLLNHAPEIKKLQARSRPAFYWIQSKNFRIPKTSPQFRQIAQAGLKPIAKLDLT